MRFYLEFAALALAFALMWLGVVAVLWIVGVIH